MMARHTRKLALRDHVWSVAKAHRQFTARELAGATNRSDEYILKALKDWTEFVYVERIGHRGRRVLFQVTGKAGNPVARDDDGEVIRETTAEGNMWRAMRKAGGTFSYVDIAMWSNTAATPVTEADAQRYCQALAAAGYLRADVKANGRGQLALYRLIRDTGAFAPRERSVKAIWDANLGDFTLLSRARA